MSFPWFVAGQNQVKPAANLNLASCKVNGLIPVWGGGFKSITRTTFDIDIVVNLEETQIQVLSAAFSLPRYYADPHQMRTAMEIGSSFNIIDSTRGERPMGNKRATKCNYARAQ